ncbi:MAG TPA: hypothetical protein DDZ53_03895 [Firmicutes bacterium]|nr:hypothetical protein [Bacillota bacterium]
MNERGGVLTTVLLLAGLLVLLAVPVLHMANAQYRMSVNEQIKTQAFYLAEAGAKHGQVEAIAHIIAKANTVGWDPKLISPAQPFITIDKQLGPGNYRVNAFLSHQDGDTYRLRIESKGIASTTARFPQIVSLTMPIIIIPRGNGMPAPPLDMALFADTAFSLAATRIRGDAVTNATGSNSIRLSWAPVLEHMISGDLTLGVGADPKTVVKLPWLRSMSEVVRGQVRNLSTPILFPNPTVPTPPSNLLMNSSLSISKGGTYTITNDSYYPEINLNDSDPFSRARLIIDVGRAERNIRVGTLRLGDWSDLRLVGTGKLNLFVDDEIIVGGSSSFNSDLSHDKALVYYGGTGVFFVPNWAAFNGTIVASKADAVVAGLAKMAGHIITGGNSVKLSGIMKAGTALIYAPNAEVDISWRVDSIWEYLGAIVSRECNIEASFPLRYDERVKEIYEELVDSGGAVVKAETPIWSPR